MVPRATPLDPSRSESTRASALLAILEECGPVVGLLPVKPELGVCGKGLLVSRESPVPEEPVSPEPD